MYFSTSENIFSLNSDFLVYNLHFHPSFLVITLYADISCLHFYPFCNPCSKFFPFKDTIPSSLSDFFPSVLVFRIYSFALDTLTRHRWGFGLTHFLWRPFSHVCAMLCVSPALCSCVSLSPFLSSTLCTSPLFQTSKLPSESVMLAALPHFSLFSAAEIPTIST